MARRPHKHSLDPRQLDLFQPQADAPPATMTTAMSDPPPEWDDPNIAWPHADFLQDEVAVLVFLYRWNDLEDAYAADGLDPFEQVKTGLLRGLKAMTEAGKSIRNRAFTVFIGDTGPGFSILAVALGTMDGKVAEFLGPYLEVPGYWTTETGVNGAGNLQLSPRFRFDHGHVIEYGDQGEEGGTRIDDSNRCGTGLTLYRRLALPAEMMGSRKSVYGRLRNADGEAGAKAAPKRTRDTRE
ncbi:hypothetical protein L6V77_16910 [Myxococcota bacterium]|nr:hypothetical protein [Myxococcota bacterium]